MKRSTVVFAIAAPALVLSAQLLAQTPTAGNGPQVQPDQQERGARAGAADLPDVEGTWAQKFVTTSISEAPLIGEVTSRTTTHQRLEIERAGEGLAVTEHTCDVNIDSSQGSVETEVPDAFVEAIRPVERSARLERRDDGLYLVMPPATKYYGVKAGDDGKPLPQEPGDPRVIDQDEDDAPGMTVRLSGLLSGELHLVQRSRDALLGTFLDGNTIAGRVNWKTEQIVLEKTGRIVGEMQPAKPHPDPAQSYFRMVKVDSDMSCADIVAKRGALFPDRSQPDK